ncbi:MAG: DUF3489 domain-containing protein [Alphaproteobacteria bacterium]
MPKLTDTQSVILNAAAQSDDGAVLPLPATLTANKGAATISLRSMIKSGLIAEQPAGPDDTVWHEADDGTRWALVVTDAGLTAIGINPAERCDDSNPETKIPGETTEAPGAVRAGTKQALLVDLLTRPSGATIAEVVAATGWQAHSVRGTISGTLKKKLGLIVSSEKLADRGRVYRIAMDSPDTGR